MAKANKTSKKAAKKSPSRAKPSSQKAKAEHPEKKKSKRKIPPPKAGDGRSLFDNEPMQVNLLVEFIGAVGTLTATLFQNITGAMIGHDSVNDTGNIIFNNARSGDVISINGNCAGTTRITINVPTIRPTPISFNPGNINDGFDIL